MNLKMGRGLTAFRIIMDMPDWSKNGDTKSTASSRSLVWVIAATAMSMSPMSKQNTWIERFWGKGHPVEQCFIPHYLISDTKSTHIGLGSIYFPINSIRGDGSRGLGPPLNFWINENKCAINQNSFLPDYFKMSRSRSLCLYWFLTPTLFTWWKFTTPSK